MGREEPPHIPGQGQKPGGPHARRAVAKRSYPTSEVRGSSREYQSATAQEWPRGDAPCQRSGGWPGGATPRPWPNKASGGDGIPVEVFQILKDDAVKVIYFHNMSANLENSVVATRLEKVSFHSNPKERQCQRMLKLPHNCTHLTR